MPKRSSRRASIASRAGISVTLRRPLVQVGILIAAAIFIYFLAITAQPNATSTALPAEISVDEAYAKYPNGAFFLDVRTQEEWDQFHAPQSTLIPLDQLASRVNEVPRDRPIVVVCRSGNRSQQGRDILLQAGFTQVTSMAGGLTEWRSKGYPVTP